MTMYGADGTYEIGSGFMYAGEAPLGLPARVYPATDTARAGVTFRPRHAYITVEGGDVRYRLDGSDPSEPFGILAKDGSTIDWTDPLRDFSGFISNCRVIAANGATSVLINCSWRN